MKSGLLASSSNAPTICLSYGESLVFRAMGDASTLLRNIRASQLPLLIVIVGQRPATEALTRILNQSKKRPSPARFGRYLDFIAAGRGLPTVISPRQARNPAVSYTHLTLPT